MNANVEQLEAKHHAIIDKMLKAVELDDDTLFFIAVFNQAETSQVATCGNMRRVDVAPMLRALADSKAV